MEMTSESEYWYKNGNYEKEFTVSKSFTLGEETLTEYKLISPESVKPLTFTVVLFRVLKSVAS